MAFEKYKPRDLFSEFYGIHTQWSWWFKTSDWFAISDYDVIFTALGGEYLASPQTSFGVRLSRVHFSFFLGEKWMRDEQTPKDVCGEASEYHKAEQNRCRKLGVLPKSFIVKPFWKYTTIQVLTTLKVRKDLMVFKQRDLLWSSLL